MSSPGRVTAAWVVGLIAAAGCVATCIGLSHLYTIGTCASGNTPYVIASPCPAGTATQVAWLGGGMTAAILATVMLAFIVNGGWKIGYSLLFLSAGVASIVVPLTHHNLPAGGSLAAWIIAATFIPMGAWPPVLWLIGRMSTGEARGLAQRGVVAPATVAAVKTETTYSGGESLINVSYRVQPVGGEHPFEVERSFSVLPGQMPKVGQRVQLRYDRRKPENFQIQDAQI